MGDITTITVPEHYSKGNKQPIEFMRECMSDEAYEGFIVGNCVKYLMRYNYKDGIKDVYKCLDYVNKLIAFKEETESVSTPIPSSSVPLGENTLSIPKKSSSKKSQDESGLF